MADRPLWGLHSSGPRSAVIPVTKEDSPGMRLGPYQLENRAGRGAMATVWYARHVDTGAPVAVKIVTAPAGRAGEFRRMFGDEVRAMAGLDHPGIVGIYDHGSVPPGIDGLPAGAPFLVMEWLDGGPLRDRRGRLAWPTLRAVLLTLLDALAHAHARGVVHRDLKDSNVMWSSRGAVITDFGLALTLDDAPTDGGFSGTPAFMAPEQIRCAMREIGPWTDLYALGCLAYALASGRPPFRGDSPAEVLQAQASAEPPPLIGRRPVPPGLGPWVERLLAKDPARRFRRAADAAWALLALPDDAPRGESLDFELEGPPTLDESSITAVGESEAGDGAEQTVSERKADGERTLLAPPVFVAVDDSSWSAPAGGQPGPPPCPADWREPPRRNAPVPPVSLARALFDLRSSTMSGRMSARDALWDALRTVTGGGGARAMVVRGAPGLGRTRLVEWLGQRAHEVGAAAVLRAAFDGEDPDEGLRVMWSRHLRATGLGPIERSARIADALGLPHGHPLPRAMCAALDPRGRFADGSDSGVVSIASTVERFETFCQALERLARRRPVLIVLDDAHLAPVAVRFVRHVLDRHGGLSLLMVATFDSTASLGGREPLWQVAGAGEVQLGPLDAEGIAGMLARRLPIDRTTAHLLTEQCRGNPLRAEQMVRRWLDAGALVEGRRGYRSVKRTPPPRVGRGGGGWSERVDRVLRVDACASLEGAAALGMSVDERRWRSVVERMIDVPSDDGRERLLDAGLARMDADGRFTFAHPGVREALLDRARRGARLSRWYLACASVLEAAGDDPVAVARHLIAGGVPDAGLARLLDVLEERRGRGEMEAVGDAVRLALRALRNLDHAPDARPRLRLRASWIAYCLVEGRVDDARRHARRQLRLVDDSSAGRARAELQMGRTLVDADPIAAIEWFERARASADRAGFVRPAIEALAFIGFCRMLEGRLDDAEPALADGLRRLQAAPDGAGEQGIPLAIRPALAGRLHLYRAWTEWKRGRLEAAELNARAALAATRRSGSRERQALAETTLGDLARHRREWDEAEARYFAAEALLDAIGFDGPRDVDCYLALVAVERGRAITALHRLERTLERAQRHRHMALVVFSATLLLSVAADTADVELWSRCWGALDPLRAGRIADPDIARALRLAGDRAGRAGMVEQADDARALAAALYEALGWSIESAQIAAQRTH